MKDGSNKEQINPETTKQLKPEISPNLSSPSHAHNAKTCRTAAGLGIHTKRIHNKKEPVLSPCPSCTRIFKTENTRTNHQKSCNGEHSSETHRTCTSCNKSLSRKNFARHRKRCQPTESPVTLPQQGNIKPNTRNVSIAPYPFPPRTWLDIGTLAEANREESVPPEWVVKAKKNKKRLKSVKYTDSCFYRRFHYHVATNCCNYLKSLKQASVLVAPLIIALPC